MRKLVQKPEIRMIILHIYEGIASSLGIKIISNNILPSIIPLLNDDSLTKGEYLAYRNTIRSLIKRLEQEADKRYTGSKEIALPTDLLMK